MEQLLAHLVGDYVLQNHWMANTKTRSSFAALVHVLFYGLPFLLLIDRVEQWAVIVGTHFLIDRFRLAAYWVDFWGTGKLGAVTPLLLKVLGFKFYGGWEYGTDHERDVWIKGLKPSNGPRERHTWDYIVDIQPAPPWLGVWLLILVDNTMHLVINHAVLRWM